MKPWTCLELYEQQKKNFSFDFVLTFIRIRSRKQSASDCCENFEIIVEHLHV